MTSSTDIKVICRQGLEHDISDVRCWSLVSFRDTRLVHIATKNGEWYPAKVLDTIKKHQMSWTNNTTIFLNITQTFNKKWKKIVFLLHGRKKWVGKKTNFILCSSCGTTHFFSFLLDKYLPSNFVFSEHLVNPLLLLVLTARMYYCWWNYSIWNSKIQLQGVLELHDCRFLVKEKVQCPCCSKLV